MLSTGRSKYVKSLWNGYYLNYDNSDSNHHDSIMSDMLAGHWYARLCNLPSVLTLEQILSCLHTIYEFNVLKFARDSKESKAAAAVNQKAQRRNSGTGTDSSPPKNSSTSSGIAAYRSTKTQMKGGDNTNTNNTAAKASVVTFNEDSFTTAATDKNNANTLIPKSHSMDYADKLADMMNNIAGTGTNDATTSSIRPSPSAPDLTRKLTNRFGTDMSCVQYLGAGTLLHHSQLSIISLCYYIIQLYT